MKPFDLEAAKRGEPIVCRDGTPAKFIAHVPEKIGEDTVLVLMRGAIHTYHENGFYLESYQEDIYDLIMAPKKRTVWVNLYKDSKAIWYESNDLADKYHEAYSLHRPRIGNRAYPVEIEE